MHSIFDYTTFYLQQFLVIISVNVICKYFLPIFSTTSIRINCHSIHARYETVFRHGEVLTISVMHIAIHKVRIRVFVHNIMFAYHIPIGFRVGTDQMILIWPKYMNNTIRTCILALRKITALI